MFKHEDKGRQSSQLGCQYQAQDPFKVPAPRKPSFKNFKLVQRNQRDDLAAFAAKKQYHRPVHSMHAGAFKNS